MINKYSNPKPAKGSRILRGMNSFPGIPMVCLLLALPAITLAQTSGTLVGDSQPIRFGLSRVEKALQKSGHPIGKIKINRDLLDAEIGIKVVDHAATIRKEGYTITHQGGKVMITAIDQGGAMYGALDVAEQIMNGKTSETIADKKVNPHFTVRAIKFNLPWSSYRTGPAMQQHMDVCRDLVFWQSFLDQMAENRFNVLSLWNVHPFSYMVKPLHFPKANNFTQKEMAEWKRFWTSLFRMARDRGIEPFIVNWNIAVSPEFAKAYHVRERNDTSAIVKRYTREVVTQVINEYPDLAGIGITLADWMSNFSDPKSSLPEMTPKSREDWIAATVVAGIKKAKRPVKFLHRSVLSSDPKEMRRVIDKAKLPDTTLVEIKFNWSHGHSTPSLFITHDSHSGKLDDGYWNPMPHNYRVQWMIRNEDFFILRWGQPDFIRSHIAQNSEPYVNGYFVGSEGYIPAKDFSHRSNPHRTWTYAFEKQWLFYQLWGRLLYDPSTPDSLFEAAFENRYGKGSGKSLLLAHAVASKMPLRLASFYRSTWDYTLYSEGFLAPSPNGGLNDKVSAFISIDELIDHPTLDPRYLSIMDFVKQSAEKQTPPAGKISPLMLADSLEIDSREVLILAEQLKSKSIPPTLACELDDLETWAYLSAYFADKLRAGVALQTFRTSGDKSQQQKATQLLMQCRTHWTKVSEITRGHYQEVPYIDDGSDASTFSWAKFLPQVERDISVAEQSRSIR